MTKELKQLQTKNLLKPRMYSFDEVKALLKAQRKEHQQELDAQHERANDHYASCLADIHSKLKKIQILADQEQALNIDISLQGLLKEIKDEKEITFQCPVCLELKPFSQFAQKKGISIDGSCKECFNQRKLI